MPERIAVEDGRRLRLDYADGSSEVFAALWLFDHAVEARDPVSGQRGGGALELDPNLSIHRAELGDGVVRLEFSSGMARHVRLGELRPTLANPEPVLWTTPEAILAAPPIEALAYLEDDLALYAALSNAARHGLTLLHGAGARPDALEAIVARFGYIRETNYGRLFTVRAKSEPENLAFTDQALELHTDNPYRDPMPTLQLLHVVEADEAGGGESLFVDGVAHAETFRRRDPAAFEILAAQPVGFAYADTSGAWWRTTAPIITLGPAGEVAAVRVNHRSLVAPPLAAERMEAWYAAYLDYVRALHAPEAAYARRLVAGDVVLFDNRRILHGRRAVLGRPGARWLQGCYADRDGLMATLARLGCGD
ncbi:MAG: TauD/TfdA family dioxygenase [Caulobacteraceae bacterium]